LSLAVVNSYSQQRILSPHSAKGAAQNRCSCPEEKSKKTSSDAAEQRKCSGRNLLIQFIFVKGG